VTSTSSRSGPGAAASPWNLPNALTFARILLVIPFVWLLLMDDGESTAARVGAGIVFVLASITDFVDGDLARRRGLVTAVGKVADPIADKALIGAALICLSVLGELPWWVTIVILVREIGITLLRLWALRYGVIAASRGGKVKTVLQLLAILLYLLPLDGAAATARSIVMAAAVVVTIVTGLDYVVRALRLRAATRSSRS
jgi:CDP-diacylglycerol--glycerol-3-phosphate 3-phosphatidyltransferase